MLILFLILLFEHCQQLSHQRIKQNARFQPDQRRAIASPGFVPTENGRPQLSMPSLISISPT
jgi:hypothetical protein